jgi:hypothetical protein
VSRWIPDPEVEGATTAQQGILALNDLLRALREELPPDHYQVVVDIMACRLTAEWRKGLDGGAADDPRNAA